MTPTSETIFIYLLIKMPSWTYRTMANASYVQFDKQMQKKP